MIRITISATAYEAIAATLPSSVGYERIRAPDGDYHVWLEPRFVDRLRAMRGPGESYSDVILRLATASLIGRSRGRFLLNRPAVASASDLGADLWNILHP
jgi:hypothetical protein